MNRRKKNIHFWNELVVVLLFVLFFLSLFFQLLIEHAVFNQMHQYYWFIIYQSSKQIKTNYRNLEISWKTKRKERKQRSERETKKENKLIFHATAWAYCVSVELLEVSTCCRDHAFTIIEKEMIFFHIFFPFLLCFCVVWFLFFGSIFQALFFNRTCFDWAVLWWRYREWSLWRCEVRSSCNKQILCSVYHSNHKRRHQPLRAHLRFLQSPPQLRIIK